jgi:hypothetical protein
MAAAVIPVTSAILWVRMSSSEQVNKSEVAKFRDERAEDLRSPLNTSSKSRDYHDNHNAQLIKAPETAGFVPMSAACAGTGRLTRKEGGRRLTPLRRVPHSRGGRAHHAEPWTETNDARMAGKSVSPCSPQWRASAKNRFVIDSSESTSRTPAAVEVGDPDLREADHSD